MKRILFILLLICISCKEKKEDTPKDPVNVEIISTEDYELHKVKNSTKLLIVFPGGGTTSQETKADFKILDKATSQGISVLLMNFGRLYLDETTTTALSSVLEKAVEDHQLPTDHIIMGGMSIGGSTSLMLANHLHKSESKIAPDKTFIIDSPIDLYALYESSNKDVQRTDFSERRLAEPKFLVDLFENNFKGETTVLDNIQKVSPVTLKTDNFENINYLKNGSLRFYTEPDTLWLKETRQVDFESSNSYTIQKTATLLNKSGWENVELIQTKNKGFLSDGTRNPHSWSIVDVDEFLKWIEKK
ncbi:hypothetical protein A9Q93_03570 [Nonlabens dokdonensis]|uniref:Alpha/beta hydrolase n=1 Tax=Nonlabens dokdonensis TaxID=328515 RepID=A0A1Z8B7Q9_9FLAO|nr:hypothetical protein [Nonlabens dokdonensis]OUS18632.1 hypothetical protein A9Q93_03570 [Nonlabens dokdonensis]